jgi:hypothetical protein
MYQQSQQEAAQVLQRLQEKEQQLAAAQGEACGARLGKGCCWTVREMLFCNSTSLLEAIAGAAACAAEHLAVSHAMLPNCCRAFLVVLLVVCRAMLSSS